MSLLSFLKGIPKAAGKVFGVLGSVLRISQPIVEHLRPMVDEIDVVMDTVEEFGDLVGEEFDGFLDQNLQVILDLESLSARAQVFFGNVNKLTAALRVASQEVTPDTIDETEAIQLIQLLQNVKEGTAPLRIDLDKTLGSLKKAQE